MNAATAAARRAFVVAALRLSVLFAVVFHGCDALAMRSTSRWALYAAWELRIPYWPAAYPLYLSVFAGPFLVLALVPEPAAIRRWERAMATTVVVAGVVFLLLPAELGYAAADAGPWRVVSQLVHAVAGTHNLVPSLHVALTLVTLRSVWPWTTARRRGLLIGWFALLVGSVLLTHQHHVADVVSGFALGWLPWHRRTSAVDDAR